MNKQYMFSNLIGFLETKVINETATPEEENLYQDYLWYGTVNKKSHTYRNLVSQYLNSSY
ncbi:hypothetical protein QNK06_11330 [Bacillus subtilis]|uniref:BH0509 family protein n=1 Tax=Bacillus stercoris TaxID=2054641 RepID=A0ABU0V2C9_9BACI|nr:MULTISPECIES: hypothetical protein [Bacillus subtilis group]WIT27661.1 hypothetical protein [Bacillus phage SPbetaL5]MBL4978778.1 hypothetical protein [Bacillus halotolerans]MBP3047274.1 hypothetical protein [Bacillus subtilis subsp. subtilis]MDQ1851080.1 hypothetical protein [Bacillus stercoris]OTQ88436.1 hypothetical protein BG31_08410 [Bacillus subtilis subsp. subtilis]